MRFQMNKINEALFWRFFSIRFKPHQALNSISKWLASILTLIRKFIGCARLILGVLCVKRPWSDLKSLIPFFHVSCGLLFQLYNFKLSIWLHKSILDKKIRFRVYKCFKISTKRTYFIAYWFAADEFRCFCSFGRWRFICNAKWSDLAKQRSQTLHLNGLAPVCLR